MKRVPTGAAAALALTTLIASATLAQDPGSVIPGIAGQATPSPISTPFPVPPIIFPTPTATPQPTATPTEPQNVYTTTSTFGRPARLDIRRASPVPTDAPGATPAPAATLTVTVTNPNTGAPIPESTFLNSATITNLDTGSSRTATFPAQVQTGRYRVTLLIFTRVAGFPLIDTVTFENVQI